MKRTFLCVALLIIAGTPRGISRTIATYSYRDLFAKSDLVVVAEPLTKTHATAEHSRLPEVNPPAHVIGVETQFKIKWVIKGYKLDHFILHHYREVPLKPNEVRLDAPIPVSFDPNKHSEYLLFLVRERDGRFAPTGGQTDVDTISVWELGQVTR